MRLQRPFINVRVGDFFKENADGAWYMKIDGKHGMCQINGSRYETKF